MSANGSTQFRPAMFAGKDRTTRMPEGMSMCAAASMPAASILETDVVTSVSLFLLVLILSLLVGRVVLLSLSGLTGLLLVSLVGLIPGLVPRTTKGD
jgi:hypothetical protein